MPPVEAAVFSVLLFIPDLSGRTKVLTRESIIKNNRKNALQILNINVKGAWQRVGIGCAAGQTTQRMSEPP